MASKLAPKISAPGSDKFPTSGPHNPNVGSHGKTSKLANVKAAPTSGSGATGSAGSFMPVQNNAMANLRGAAQPKVPNTAAAATKKPNRKGGAAFYGES